MAADAAATRTSVAFGPFRLHFGKRLLEKEAVPVALGSRAMDVLIALVERAGDVVTKQELTRRVWPNITVDESSLRVHVATLRKALGDGRNGARYVTNISGRGYCFVAPVTPGADGAHGDAATAFAPLVAQASAAPSATGLPRPLSRMIGREAEVREISAQLATHRFVTLHGPGGIGKTTVAVAVAHAELGAFANAVAFVDLGAITDPALLGTAVAASLGVAVRSGDPLPGLLAYLRPRQMLLVLDNCEPVIDAAAQLAESIFREAPRVNLLATSRESLRVEGEHVYELSALEAPPQQAALDPSRLRTFAAAHLFIERAAAIGYDVALNDANAAIVAEICRKLDGNPLAIELAAGRVGTHGLSALAELLDSRLRLVWQGRRTAAPRHQTLNATLDWSHNLISETERAVLRRVSILNGGFTLPAAEMVAADRSLDVGMIAEAMEQLVAKSLVQAAAGEMPARYRLLDTMRAYARTKLADSGEEPAVARRHADFFRAYLERASLQQTQGGGTARDPIDRASLLGNVLAALDWCFSEPGDAQLGVRLVAAAAPFFIGISQLDKCRRWTERALTMLDSTEFGTRVEMELQAGLGHSLMLTSSNSERAGTALERAREIATSLGDQFNRFRILGRLHLYYRRTGEATRSLEVALEMQAVAAEIDDPVARASADAMLGFSHIMGGNQAKGRFHTDQAFALSEDARPTDPGHFAFYHSPYLSLSRVLWLQGQADQAIEVCRALAEAPLSDVDPVSSCISLIFTANVYGWVGEWATVEKQAERLIAHAGAHFLVPYRNVGLALKAERLIQRGDLDEGLSLLRRSIARLEADRYRLYISGFRCTLASGLAASGQLDEAVREIDGEISTAESLGTLFIAPELLRIKGELCGLQNDKRQAYSLFESAFEMAGQQAALSWQLRAAMSMMRLVAGSGDATAAHNRLAETYGRFTEGFATADLKAAKQLLGKAVRRPR
jgi:predicted ATPase/DNA-binding winged helix-turn-helix (wHTH) protein